MDDLLMIATLIERLKYQDLSSMAGLLMDSAQDSKTDWKDKEQVMSLLNDWAVCQVESAEEAK